MKINKDLLWRRNGWKLGQQFVGRGGGSHVWEITSMGNGWLHARSLKTKEYRAFHFQSLLPVELCEVKMSYL